MKRFEVEKDFTHRGFRCVVLFGSLGFRTGYVGLPKGHEFYGKDYDDLDIKVHGGLTYAGENSNYPVPSSDVWWIGFDTGHCDDGLDLKQALKYGLIEQSQYEMQTMFSFQSSDDEPRSLEYCVKECELIVDQVAG